jgi:transposase InsO family protein
MSRKSKGGDPDGWARLRFSIVGPLLAAPPARGELQAELERLAAKQWLDPVTQEPTRFGLSTIQRWYYEARAAEVDPVAVLRRKVRSDLGAQPSVGEELRRLIQAQYADHQRWTYQLHYDNLAAAVKAEARYGVLPSYSSVLRYMKSHGLVPRRVTSGPWTPGREQAQARLEALEVRSFESEYAHGLWHLDFHQSRTVKVLTPAGELVKPILLGILDDHSRLCCHAQWYLTEETAEVLIHGLCQAFAKRGLPRSLMTDRGTAMLAAETRTGLERLGIVHSPTLPYSPYQNGKQEAFWGPLEGRLMAMLDNLPDLDLEFLNRATQAWAELEYQRHRHEELGSSPLERFLKAPQVGRPCPPLEDLRQAFCRETTRRQRTSDGTLTLSGVRLEVPSRFRHFQEVRLRYASWDLSHVYLVDPHTKKTLVRLYPLDRAANNDGRRRALTPITPAADPGAGAPSREMAPLLRQLMQEYAATGLPPAYIPFTPREES